MASAWSQLEQMLTCAICLDKFKNPRLLPCQHSFCGDACMDGLVDYARRQIKCPECRAEHRIPYQGVSSLPSNVTLIRFLELHSRITGEEPEPVPTFMEKCSICGEKVDGVQRCSHCDKKVCPDCKEAHIDLLRREINRINGQSKRCLSKIQEFKDVLEKSEERLNINHTNVRNEIEQSCRRLIEDLQNKQKRLIEEVDTFKEQEQKTIDKLKIAIVDELKVLDSNSKLADDKVGKEYQWTDQELSEMKEIYAKAMEFVRLFDPEIGDFTRKMRFILIPEFETLRRRICELGELKFGESADSLMANALQHCNATGVITMELCNSAAAQAAAMAAHATGSTNYGLSHSSSNSNLGLAGSGGGGGGQSTMLELPSMQNSLMRSQSDHRLASQFQQRLKQQQLQLEASKNGTLSSSGNRYGTNTSRADYETESLRSRYAPRGSTGAVKDYSSDLLTRDWPRPSDNDGPDMPFGSSIQFKSAFMRRKEKERQQTGGFSSAYSNNNNDDDDDLTSEASYGGHSTGGRNVRFYDPSGGGNEQQSIGARQPLMKLFDCKEVEHGPLSGVPRLDGSAHLLTRLHQMGAKAIVDKKNAEEEGRRDKDLVESARQAMSKASERKSNQRQVSEDEVEKQKKANKQQQQQQQQQQETSTTGSNQAVAAAAGREEASNSSGGHSGSGRAASSSYSRDSYDSRHSPTPTAELNSSASTVVEVEPNGGSAGAAAAAAAAAAASQAQPSTPPSPATSGRRNLYGQAVTEKSKRQLSNAIQDAASYSRRRAAAAASATTTTGSSSVEGEQTPEASSASSSATTTTTTTTTSGRVKRTLRSSGRSMSKQSSIDQSVDGTNGTGGSSLSGTGQRRRRALIRGESSQQSLDSASIASAGSGGARQGGSLAAIGQSTASSNSETSTTTTMAAESKNFATGSGGHSDNSQSSHQGPLTAAKQVDRGLDYANHRSAGKQTSTTTDEDADMDNLEEDERRTPTRPKTAGGSYLANRPSKERRIASARTLSDDDDDDDDDNDDDDDDNGNDNDELDENDNDSKDDKDKSDHDDDDDGRNSNNDYAGSRNAGNRRSREMLPNAVNKLLDRSAQIRRDSQEQRSRGDSPQRSQPSRSYYSSRTGATTSASLTGYSSSPGSSSAILGSSGGSGGMSSATRQRLAYQRSQSNRDSQHQDDDVTNSNNSIYTTASSGSQMASTGRRSSAEDEFTHSGNSGTTRRSSGHSTDRTLISDHSRPSYKRESSGESGPAPAYQSRFLSRSRTSAALSNSGSSNRSQESSVDAHLPDSSSFDRPETSSHSAARSYLSSRDRFMQSASLMSSSATPSATATGGSQSGSSNLYTRSGSSAAVQAAPFNAIAGLSQYAYQPSSRLYYNDNSPFIELDDEDDEYSAYFPSGMKTHSEYLRNKFNRRTSSNSSASSALLRSRSSHAAFTHDSDDDDDDDDDDHNNHLVDANENPIDELGSDKSFALAHGSRRSSLASTSFDSQLPRTVYSGKKRMLFKIGSRGSSAGNFTWPRGVAVGFGASGREVVVADSSNHRVQVFDSSGKFLHEFGSYGSAQGEFDCLAGVAINRVNRNYVVSDRYNHRIQVFDMNGRFVRAFGEMGKEAGKFNLPWGVACDSSGLIYVCDKENHRIQIFDVDGTHLNKFGVSGNQAGQLQHPHYIAVGQSKVVVTDTNNHRVQVFDLSGRLIQSFGKEGSQQGQFKFPRGVAMDEQGFIIVGDSGNNRLQVFNPDGLFVKAIGTWGSADGEFKGIEGVAVDTNHNVLVCDRENHRIQVF